MKQFQARHGELLCQHLATVASGAERALTVLPLAYAFRLATLAHICGLCHDAGKYTSYFQDKLSSGREPKPAALGFHAPLSALLAAYVVLSRRPQDVEGALLSYLSVHRHHGPLYSPWEVLPEIKGVQGGEPVFEQYGGGGSFAVIGQQISDIRQNHGAQVVEEMTNLGIPEMGAFLEQRNWWETLVILRQAYDQLRRQAQRRRHRHMGGGVEYTALYWQQLLIFSALIHADKYTAGQVTRPVRPEIPAFAVHNYIRTLSSSGPLATLRRQVYTEAVKAIQHEPLAALYPGVVRSLTAPTGAGKTLTGLVCALELRERVQKEIGYTPRLIYSLPFVNVIDQNAEVFDRVLRQLVTYNKSPSAHLLRRHHLAEPAFREEEEKRSVEEATLLAESWESEIIVTTFVQLFESLVTSRNRVLKKLPHLAGSIIVLDEIQAVPCEQWGFIERVLLGAAQQLGCSIILMTATRPVILGSARELLPEPERHFRNLNRTVLKPRPDIKNGEQLAEFALEQHHIGKSVLVVVNTVRRAVEVYETLAALMGEEGVPYIEERGAGRQKELWPGPLLFHLSTNICPVQRGRRVHLLRRLLSKRGIGPAPFAGWRPSILVSTQVVEAGVDIDFDVVIRDIAPLDAIVQVAGRCNRNAVYEPAPVYITFLERDSASKSDDTVNGGSPSQRRRDAELVYGQVLIQVAMEFLHQEIYETDLLPLINQFFAEVAKRKDTRQYQPYLDAMEIMNFGSRSVHISLGSPVGRQPGKGPVSVGQYRFIEEGERAPVIVELNADAAAKHASLLQLLANSAEKSDIQEAYRQLAPYTISPILHRIYALGLPKNPDLDGYFYIPLSERDRFYNLQTGLRLDKGEVIL